jgi:acyl-CoA synthetase (AMP-forming)/AMP-acid ligase II
VFVGYLDPHHNKDLGVEIDGENWLNTGNLGRRDSDGYFWLAGRRKELIIRGGHNIDPKLIEEALLKHPSVAMVAGRLDGSNPEQRRSKIAGKKSAQKLIGPSNAMRAFAGTGAIFDRLTDRKVPAASPLSCAHQ